MAESTIENELEISPELLSDLGDLAGLPGKSLAQAGIDPEGAAAHLELAKRRAVAVTTLLTAVGRAAKFPGTAHSDPAQTVDLGEQIALAEAGMRGAIDELPWDLSIHKPVGTRLQAGAESLRTLLDGMLALALVWFPEGGALSLAVVQEGKLTWTRMDYVPGPDSPSLVDTMQVLNQGSNDQNVGEPAGLVALGYLAQAAGAEVQYELAKQNRVRLSIGLPGSVPIPRARRGTQVLVVDDDPDSAFMLEQAVGKAGYRTVTAYDGLTALSRARDEQVVLVLLDVMLPGMDGYEVLRKLRSEPSTANLPIVLVSAKSRPEDIETGLRLGANEYLTKPLRLADVVACVRNLIGEPSEA